LYFRLGFYLDSVVPMARLQVISFGSKLLQTKTAKDLQVTFNLSVILWLKIFLLRIESNTSTYSSNSEPTLPTLLTISFQERKRKRKKYRGRRLECLWYNNICTCIWLCYCYSQNVYVPLKFLC
jgi:hypothetical protein